MDRKAVWGDLETDSAVNTEMHGYLRLAEKRVGEPVAVAYGGVVWAAHYIQGLWYPVFFLTGLQCCTVSAP